ncbi:hypothetical protein C0984_19590, partial [Clostridioides difficile]
RPRGRTAFPGASGLGPLAGGVDQLSRGIALPSEGPRDPPALPGDSRSSPSARGVDQHSWATRARVRGLAALASSHG